MLGLLRGFLGRILGVFKGAFNKLKSFLGFGTTVTILGVTFSKDVRNIIVLAGAAYLVIKLNQRKK